MTARLGWRCEQDAVCITLTHHVSEAEIVGLATQIAAHLDNAFRPIHLIVDWRAAHSINVSFPDILRVKAIQHVIQHQHLGWIIAVGHNAWARTFLTLAAFELSCKVVASHPDALRFVTQLRTAVPRVHSQKVRAIHSQPSPPNEFAG